MAMPLRKTGHVRQNRWVVKKGTSLILELLSVSRWKDVQREVPLFTDQESVITKSRITRHTEGKLSSPTTTAIYHTLPSPPPQSILNHESPGERSEQQIWVS